MTSRSSRGAGLRSVPSPDSPSPFPATIPAGAPDLIGREVLLVEIMELLSADSIRLVTLTGAGGVGKTRLAVEAARRLSPSFASAVIYVPLSSVADPDFVLPAVVHAAGWSEQGTRTSLEVLVDGFGSNSALLVLDNLEQVVEVAPDLASLLDECPRLTVLATSRVALRTRAEHTITVPPLAVPDAGGARSLRAVAENESVALLLQTARRFDRAFSLTPDNADSVLRICQRLDGLPLALELAAARLRLLSPLEMLRLLDRQLDLLRGVGDPGAPEHHRTMRATVEWSYRLLSAPDQTAFVTLGVFSGGFDLTAAATVAGTDAYTMLDTLERLVDHHLVHTRTGAAGERRFHMLDTLRAYALEELAAQLREPVVRSAHADWCRTLVEGTAAELTGPRQADALTLLDREHDNILAALAWLTDATTDTADTRGLRLAAAMWRYWWIRGELPEGRTRIERVLGRLLWDPTDALADAAYAAGDLAEAQGAYRVARKHFEHALAIRTSLGDGVGCAACWNSLGYVARVTGDLGGSEALHERALVELSAAGADRGIAISLSGLGAVAYLRGDVEVAVARWEENTDVVRRLGDRMMLARQLGNLGMARAAQGRLDLARAVHEEALALAREFGDVSGIVFALTNLAAVLVQLGELTPAAALLDEALDMSGAGGGMIEAVAHDTYGSLEQQRGRLPHAAVRFSTALEMFARLGDMEHLVGSLEHLGVLAADARQWQATTDFLAAADRLRADTGTRPVGPETDVIASARSTAAAALGERDAAVPAPVARVWTTEEILVRAREFVATTEQTSVAERAPDPLRELGLTAREADVARRLVDRRTDREIADELALSLRTVTTHVSAVLRKLGVSSRRDVEAALGALSADREIRRR